MGRSSTKTESIFKGLIKTIDSILSKLNERIAKARIAFAENKRKITIEQKGKH